MQKTIDSVFNDFNERIKASFPSVFTKEDVLLLLDEMKREHLDVIHPNFNDDFNNIKEDVIEALKSFDYDDDIEVNIGYDRRVEVDFNPDSLVRDVTMIFNNYEK